MFLKGKAIIPAILFLGVVILLVLMFSSNSYVPYSRNDVFHDSYSMYEGFAEEPTAPHKKEEGDKKESITEMNITSPPAPQLPPAANDKKEGFEDRFDQTALGYTALHENNTGIIDKFSHVDNTDKSANCYSAGLSNSKGPMCLTPELIDLLKTRGHNM